MKLRTSIGLLLLATLVHLVFFDWQCRPVALIQAGQREIVADLYVVFLFDLPLGTVKLFNFYCGIANKPET